MPLAPLDSEAFEAGCQAAQDLMPASSGMLPCSYAVPQPSAPGFAAGVSCGQEVWPSHALVIGFQATSHNLRRGQKPSAWSAFMGTQGIVYKDQRESG